MSKDIVETKLTPGDNPADECWCGDYRHQHDAKGCRVCGQLRGGYNGCRRFRLAFRVGERGAP